jgi:hypothetical protein
MFGFEKLEVWQRSIEFADAVYSATRSFPADERFGLTNQMRRAAVSISSNIAEGSARISRKDFARFIESLAKLARGGQGQACDLSVPIRRALPRRSFRRQAPSDKLHGSNLPDSVRGGQRVTGMTAGQSNFPSSGPSPAGKPAARPACGSPTSCPTPRKSPAKSAWSARCTPRPSTTTPPSPS